jgi:lysophospholipase L1-like esterase
MKSIQLILIVLSSLSGCAENAGSSLTANTKIITSNTTKMSVNDSHTYLALGDSYTIGESVQQEQSFPYQLASLLTNNGLNVKPPTIIATTGWTTDNLINAISQSSSHSNTYDFVTLLIGVNDQYQGVSQENYQVKFAQVLNTAIAFAKGDSSRVFVISIPDYGVTPFAQGRDDVIGPQIDQFNAINKSISLKAGVHYLNITGISRQAATDLSLVAGDGLHPSAKMYALWVQKLEPMVAALLKK